ncbi:MAG: Polyketide cyclase/dehydrase [Microbacteriaceae bacterium]|nr:Polyketide cyclase/dehydrase [Microbacteriaceae bacterium]
MRIIEHTVEIEAPPEKVWLEFSRTDDYGEWNPFIPQLSGAFHVGSRLSVTIRPGERQMTFRPTVVSVERNRTVQWLGRLGVPGIFDGRHEFHLEPLSSGGTRFTQRESFSGLLVGALGSVLADTELGFAAMNEALRSRVELKLKAIR